MNDAGTMNQMCISANERLPTGVPNWVASWVTGETSVDGDVVVREGNDVILASIRVENARCADGNRMRKSAASAFGAIFAASRRIGCPNPVRVWSFIPGIVDRITLAGQGVRDRYIAFNAGRYEAMLQYFGGEDSLSRCAPAASGVDIGGNDLEIHALFASDKPRAIENVLQKPSYLYSRRYGELPPCFSRAMFLKHPVPCLLVSGTAAIRGEDSLYPDSPHKQFTVTLENLEVLLESVRPRQVGEDVLTRFTALRVYSPKPAVFGDFRAVMRQIFPCAAVEIRKAKLCRSDLAIEIEGLARA